MEPQAVFRAVMVPVFQQVVQLRDRYGLHAYLTALENANLRGKLEAQLQSSASIEDEEKSVLQKVLQTGALPPRETARTEEVPSPAAPRP